MKYAIWFQKTHIMMEIDATDATEARKIFNKQINIKRVQIRCRKKTKKQIEQQLEKLQLIKNNILIQQPFLSLSGINGEIKALEWCRT